MPSPGQLKARFILIILCKDDEASGLQQVEVILHSVIATWLQVWMPFRESRLNLVRVNTGPALILTYDEIKKFQCQFRVALHAYPSALMPNGHAEGTAAD